MAGSSKSITDEILEELFDRLEAAESFDEISVELLRQLAGKGQLRNRAAVTGVLKPVKESDN